MLGEIGDKINDPTSAEVQLVAAHERLNKILEAAEALVVIADPPDFNRGPYRFPWDDDYPEDARLAWLAKHGWKKIKEEEEA